MRGGEAPPHERAPPHGTQIRNINPARSGKLFLENREANEPLPRRRLTGEVGQAVAGSLNAPLCGGSRLRLNRTDITPVAWHASAKRENPTSEIGARPILQERKGLA